MNLLLLKKELKRMKIEIIVAKKIHLNNENNFFDALFNKYLQCINILFINIFII